MIAFYPIRALPDTSGSVLNNQPVCFAFRIIMDTLKTRAFILKSPNDYQAWRIETYYQLLAQGWYGHNDDTDPRPDDVSKPAQQAWDREGAKALAFVNGMMSPSFKLQFKASNTLQTIGAG